MTHRRRVVALATLAAVLVLAAPAPAHEPDLVADPPERPAFQIDSSDANLPERLLLRFDGHVHNAGAGPLEIRRNSGVVEQILRDAGNLSGDPLGMSPMSASSMVFENTDGHNHWHLQRIARYSLYDATGTAPIAPVMKVGFCLLDSTPISGTLARTYTSNCGAGRPTATTVQMGVSSGWRDLYARNLPFQWVDVSETQPGDYRLRAEIDPFNLVVESDETNIPGEANVTVPGYAAQVADADVQASPTTFSLIGTAHGTGLGARRFKIVTAPEHGTLNVSVGAWFTAADVEYTPADAAQPQPDRFTFVADDATTNYPRHPGRATVVIGLTGAERVALWGVPESVQTGLTVELNAQLTNATGAIAWDVTDGTIDSAGRFTAPAAIPAGGKVTVTARGPGGAVDAMDITIAPPPAPPEPAPTPPLDAPGDASTAPASTPDTSPLAPPAPAAPRASSKKAAVKKRTPIGSVRVRRVGPQFAVAIVARSPGRVRASLMRSRRRVATCMVRAPAKRPVLCRLKVRRGATSIAVTLVRADGRIERRRVHVPRLRA